jgi:hypothetical protein
VCVCACKVHGKSVLLLGHYQIVTEVLLILTVTAILLNCVRQISLTAVTMHSDQGRRRWVERVGDRSLEF